MVLSRYNLIKMDGVDNVMHGNNIILPLLQLLTVIVVVRIKITPDLQLNPVITVIKVSIKNTLIFHDKSVFYNNKIGGNFHLLNDGFHLGYKILDCIQFNLSKLLYYF